MPNKRKLESIKTPATTLNPAKRVPPYRKTPLVKIERNRELRFISSISLKSIRLFFIKIKLFVSILKRPEIF